jgi:hypothetical protein
VIVAAWGAPLLVVGLSLDVIFAGPAARAVAAFRARSAPR